MNLFQYKDATIIGPEDNDPLEPFTGNTPIEILLFWFENIHCEAERDLDDGSFLAFLMRTTVS